MEAEKQPSTVHVGAQFTLAEEHAQGTTAVPAAVAEQQRCTEVVLRAPFAPMNGTCAPMLAAVIAYVTPLTHEDRRACYAQVGDVVGLALGYVAMPAKEVTLAQERQMCSTPVMSITCTADGPFGESGLAAMCVGYKTKWQTAIADLDASLACTGNCDYFCNVAHERALDWRHKMLKGAPGTVDSHYQGCMAGATELNA